MHMTDHDFRLKSYVNPRRRQEPYGGLSQYACLIAFLHWTSKSCKTIESDLRGSSFRCPMLWCRQNFNDLSGILQHIPMCPCLDDGYYWCADCSKPERFMENRHNVEVSKEQGTPFRKDSRLKRASTFFKGLGHGGSITKSKAKSCGNSVLEASSAVLTRVFERKRRRQSQDVPAISDKEVLGSAHTLSGSNDVVQHLYNLDNLQAEDLQQLLGDFGEGESLKDFF